MVRVVWESGSTTTAVPGTGVNDRARVAPALTVVSQPVASAPLPVVQPEGTTTGGSTDGGRPPHAGDGRGESAPRVAAAGHQLTHRARPGGVGAAFAAVGDDGFGRLTGSGGPFPTSSPMTTPTGAGWRRLVLAPARGTVLA
jgi:hypothetical protein